MNRAQVKRLEGLLTQARRRLTHSAFPELSDSDVLRAVASLRAGQGMPVDVRDAIREEAIKQGPNPRYAHLSDAALLKLVDVEMKKMRQANYLGRQ